MTKKLTHESFDKEVLEALEEQEAAINPSALLQQLMTMTRPTKPVAEGLGQLPEGR